MIYLVRHGQTDWNLFKRCNGVTDTFLNKTGKEQAKLQADNLKNVGFDACFCSPLTRARQFCETIYKDSIIFDDRLTEICCGDFEGKHENLFMMLSLWLSFKSGRKGTERFDVFIKRNCDLCDEIMRKHKGENILIVTHAANVRVINYYFSGTPKDYDFKKGVARNNEFLTFDN